MLCAAAITTIILAAIATSAGAPQPPPAAVAPADREAPDHSWALRIGRVIEVVRDAVPVVDRVVLVPDAATYLNELGKWSPHGRWPVLFEDDHLAPMFVRRFDPATIIRRESVAPGAAATDLDVRRREMESVVIRAWGGDPASDTVRGVFDRLKHAPVGVVIASAGDPAWTAAVALAAGRAEPLAWLDEDCGRLNAVLPAGRAAALRAQVEALVAASGYPYAGLGDGIDTITVCRSLAGSVYVDLPPGQRVRPDPAGGSEPRATTDILGRDGNFDRFAFTGWIFGDERRCAYVAMCALFAPRERAWLVNTYEGGGQSAAYDTAATIPTLQAAGFEIQSLPAARATLEAWRGLVALPVTTDLLLMNTKGNVDFFDLASGRARTTDVPILDTPAAVQFIHSWSLRLPADEGTIGATWLAHGAYAYVGAVHEPFLGAFAPPAVLARRIAAGVPLLVAARWWPGDGVFEKPWKVNTLGDPLMPCAGPARVAPRRIASPVADGAHLGDSIADLMRRCDEDRTGESFAVAIRTLVLLGRDEVAIGLWSVARERGIDAAASRPILGPLFRSGRVEEFTVAWGRLTERDKVASDMLWLLLGSRLRLGADDSILLALEGGVRPEQAHIDAERLAPFLAQRFGRARVRVLIERELARAESGRVRRSLAKLLNQF